ncbi:MAG: S-layer homology domain-containing protein [bacterium]
MIPYVEKAQQLGIIDGQTTGGVLKFRPNDSVTRAESVKMVVQASSV